MTQWISVNERTPYFFDTVIVTDGTGVGVATFHCRQGWLRVGTLDKVNCIITHWQPMPEPPVSIKESKENHES